jgi:ribonuclease R
MGKKIKPPTFSTEKQQKLYDNFSKVIQQFLRGKRYTPMGKLALFKKLNIPSALHPLCTQILDDLVKQGIVQQIKKQFSLKKPEVETLIGTLRMHPRGFGFVVPEQPSLYPQDIFIPKYATDNAVDGDKVEVIVSPDSGEKGPEGRIVHILKRGRSHLAGIIRDITPQGSYIAFVPLLGASKPIQIYPSNHEQMKTGDRVIIKVLEWGDKNSMTVGEISHYLGHISDPSCDIPAAIEEFDLPDTFSKSAIKEAESFGKKPAKNDLKGRTDLTDLECFTIDPETAKDFDDALSLTKDRKGIYHLGVHIADAAYYVRPNSLLDQEAYLRCNSTYFPGACIPMLPEELSNHLCSLKEKVIRLTVSVLMDFNADGTLIHYQIVRSYINSRKQFTYEQAKKIIDGKEKSSHAASLKKMVELCLLLKKKRYERGSIDFALPDLVIQVDKKGQPIGLKWVEYDISHQLVEEFMLKANEVVAKHLSDHHKPVLYRIHEEPSKEDFEDFFNLARSLGFSVPSEPAHEDIQNLFEQAKKTSFSGQLAVAFIRNMKLAIYSPENVGHYGLALEHYCHFTSPIRRYSDLVTQRLLFDEIDDSLDMEKIALKCSEQERVSFKAEMSVKTLKKLRYLALEFKEDPNKHYPAVITRVKPFGIYFEITSLMLEGFLHISELEDDYFLFDPKSERLIGKYTGKKHIAGETITVQLQSIDFILQESKWGLVSSHPRKKSSKHPPIKRPRRKS